MYSIKFITFIICIALMLKVTKSLDLDETECNNLPRPRLDLPITNGFGFQKTQNFKQMNNTNRKRGRRGGIRTRNRKRGVKKPFLPVIILGNARSIVNKIEEIEANSKHFYEYRESSVMCFTETWLKESMPDSQFHLTDFTLIRSDRTTSSGKSCGGGVCLYFNNKWTHTNNIHVKQRICNENVELLSVSVRPYYLPREYTHVIFNAVYVPPSADASVASRTISDCLHEQATQHPDSVRLVMGDFNHCSLASSCPQMMQYITCPTRLEKTIDLCYGNVKNAYKASALPPIGESDHNVIHLTPMYKPLYKRVKPMTKEVRVWTDDATDQLRDCFATTEWSTFTRDSDDINAISEVVTDYVHFCSDSIIPTKTVKCFANNKPWVDKKLKDILNDKKRAFKENNKDKIKEINKKLKEEIRAGKKVYKNKIEDMFKSNDSKSAWLGMKTAAGISGTKTNIRVNNEIEYANDLNTFYSRFDRFDFFHQITNIKLDLQNNDTKLSEIKQSEVERVFKKVNIYKASGPDRISGRVLKSCYTELSSVFTFMFNLSLSTGKIPIKWKTSEIIPVPKKHAFVTMNDLRPVALTSIIMKCFEKIVLNLLREEVNKKLDPMQFAYKAKRSVEDAVLVFVNSILKHLETPHTYVRTLFVDFSSAFNTIQPHIMCNKLLFLGVHDRLVLWISDFLTNRTQYVKLNNTCSKTCEVNTGAPQGCVLSPTLYTLYTNDYRVSNAQLTSLVKFADDSAFLGFFSSTPL